MTSTDQLEARDLSPLSHLQPSPPASLISRTILIILNTPLLSAPLLKRLWPTASYRICADGGANRLYSSLPDERESYLPSRIHGDLDSLAPSVREFYTARGVRVTRDPDQYSTDFGKAIKTSLADLPGAATDVLVLGSLAGRVDHGLGLLGELLREQRAHPRLRVWLFGEASVSFVLGQGWTRIALDRGAGLVTENVGVVPVYGPARIGMKGFEWDVTDWETEMGGQMSTSNHIRADVVEVETDREVLFTVEMTEMKD